jgi:hypothetical protein
MNYFKNRIKDLGEVKEGTTKTVVFQALANIQSFIHNVESSCSCSKAKVSENKLTVKFKAKKIPAQTRDRGYMDKKAFITLTYNTGVKETLYIEAKIII